MKYRTSKDEGIFVPEGEYDVCVIEANEAVAKSGSDMIKLKLAIDGHSIHVFDYLVFTPESAWKIDTFRKSIGDDVQEDVEVEINASDFVGREGRVKLKVDEYNGKKNNKVAAWIYEKESTGEPF